MRGRLGKLDRARSEFIANASHELRTPLFSLGGFLELMADEEVDEETRQEFLETMREQVDRLAKLATDLLDLATVAKALGHAGSVDALDAAVSPRGFRLLAKVPRLPVLVIDRLVEHFGGMQKLLAASIDDLQTVEGVGECRARSVREGLSRLAESSILERYV